MNSVLGNFTFAPALGWIPAIIICAALLVVAIVGIVLYRRRGTSSDTTVWACARRSAIALVLAVMTLTPSMVTSTTSKAVNATDVFIAVDVTGSMAVNDAHYDSDTTITRKDAAVQAIQSITKLYPDASFAGIRFGASGTLDVPLTPDSNAIDTWAQTLSTESTFASSGSNLDAPLDQLLIQLKAARTQHPDDALIVYYISDGEQTSTETRRSFSSLRQYLDDATTVGVGSSEGGKIPVTDSTGSSTGQQWVIDPSTKQPGISKMDSKNLKAIADEMSGRYIALDANHTLANSASAEASKQYRLTITPKERIVTAPLIWPFAIALTILLLWEAAAWLVTSRRML
ncbi:vWA domain-containing protein [Bifidobacterium sp.]|jgi:Ca-activated chloride channel family protein|uniref:vWA domain-containing protein n=1 Tax=Bifidobacterium sp. TaxID=41200 RepID=UPI0025BA1CFB|nr:vWA domain-containing protein [Bifidobacterium sp.]MCI1635547.1 VWA domain-containing protein [Bifidobacterium sp.]